MDKAVLALSQAVAPVTIDRGNLCRNISRYDHWALRSSGRKSTPHSGRTPEVPEPFRTQGLSMEGDSRDRPHQFLGPWLKSAEFSGGPCNPGTARTWPLAPKGLALPGLRPRGSD